MLLLWKQKQQQDLEQDRGLPNLMTLTLPGNFRQEKYTHLPREGFGFRSPVEVCLLTLEHVCLLTLGAVQLIRKALQLKVPLNLSPADTRQGTQTVLKKCTLSSHPPRTLLHLPRVPWPSRHLPGTQSHPAPSLELTSQVTAHILPLSGSPVGYL